MFKCSLRFSQHSFTSYFLYGLGINYNKTKVMIVDIEHDNHREIKSVGRCEVFKVLCTSVL
ncbi:unnamed protein product [Callosobruchus maculatus]|uniref:Uncharacterized protein n=1 Tax=Callosobruchus maculatus TaxID=64391 RepID=A0A653CIC5_CALMS|nr:unnamed protein product [Callosobruchus maculatus]